MKSNLKIVFGIIMVALLFNSGVVFAEGENPVAEQGKSIVGNAISGVMGTVATQLTGALGAITGNPILTGVIGGAASAFMTYKDLDEKVNLEIDADRVNISDRKQEFIDDKSYDELVIDPETEIIITDSNVLDVDFKETVKDLTAYKDETKNPTIRLTEKTEIVSVLDTNNTKTDGQRRGILFQDPNQTIKDAYEYRTLLIRYNEARYDKQPLDIKIGAGDIISESWYQVFSSGMSTAKRILTNKILNFEISDKKYPEIPVEKTQKFHLLFNSRVDDNITIDNSLLDCTSEDGKPIGTTGKEVLPRIVLNWDFLEKTQGSPEAITGEKLSRDTWCDLEANGVYCDATQFSVEVLQKIKNINDYVDQYKDCFTCPVNYLEQELISETNNTGLIYLSGNITDDLSKAIINYKVRGNYQVNPEMASTRPLFDINYTIEKKSSNSFNWVTIASGTLQSVNVSYLNDGGLTEENKEITLNNKPTSEDTIRISLNLTNYNSIVSNYETGNNLLDNSLSLETSQGLTACNIEKTSDNLLRYSQSCEKKYDEKMSNFKTYLMKDGYSLDFRKDFDEHYRFTLFQTPDWYSKTESEYSPLYKYFIDKDKFNFKSNFSESISETGIPGPGRYSINVVIKYDDNWKLFNQAGDMTGKIDIIINKEQGPELDSPLYYMPIDGVVGKTGDKTRNGYGVDYLNDSVMIDHTFNQGTALQTQGFISSNTITTVDTKEIKDFGIMNNGSSRGKLLEIQRLDNKLSLKYIPSRPTPVVMSVTNKAVNTDAFAFYKLSIGLPLGEGGDVANPGESLAYWTGFAQCKDFTGVPLLERFLATPDIISVKSELSPITQSQSLAYGMEWPKDTITRTGTVWMYTIFYTPSNFRTGSGLSYLYRDSVNDSLKFYVGDLGAPEANSVALSNSLGSQNDIKSIKAIFDLVKTKKACINYDGSTLDVYYNPKEISKPLTDLIDSKLEANKDKPTSEFSCIRN